MVTVTFHADGDKGSGRAQCSRVARASFSPGLRLKKKNNFLYVRLECQHTGSLQAKWTVDLLLLFFSEGGELSYSCSTVCPVHCRCRETIAEKLINSITSPITPSSALFLHFYVNKVLLDQFSAPSGRRPWLPTLFPASYVTFVSEAHCFAFFFFLHPPSVKVAGSHWDEHGEVIKSPWGYPTNAPNGWTGGKKKTPLGESLSVWRLNSSWLSSAEIWAECWCLKMILVR